MAKKTPVIAKQQIKSSNNATNLALPKVHKWYKGVIIIGLGLGVIGAVLFFFLGGATLTERTEMQDYLRDKYGGEFVVGDIKTTGGGLGVEGYRKEVHIQRGMRILFFEVFYSTRNERHLGRYSDTYLNVLWSRDESKELEREFASTLGRYSNYTLNVSVPQSISGGIDGNVPSFDMIQERYPGDISYSLSVGIQGGSNFSDREKEGHLGNIYKLVEIMKEKNISKLG